MGETPRSERDPRWRELAATFRVELGERVGAINGLLVELERQADRAPILADQLRAVMREVHSLKGAARAVAHGPIERLAHALESALDTAIRNGTDIGPGWFDVVYRTVETLGSVLDAAEHIPAVAELEQLLAAVRPEQPRLHLWITQRDGRWYCPEVLATQSLGYGTYRFDVQGPLGDLDPNVVLGLFTWNDDPAYDHRELDVELARWGNPLAPNGQFTLHPNTPSVQRFTFSQPIDTTRGVYSIAWQRDRVTFGSLARSTSKPAAAGRLVAEHTFTEAIPPAGGEHPRINLWLSEGRPPTDARDVEVIIRRFDFAP